MEVVRGGETRKGPAEWFDGDVELVSKRQAGDGMPAVARVTFKGARTHWHSHAGGQLLYVLEGRGRAGTEADGATALEPGDLVVTRPGERHWHGSADGESMTHLAISFGATEWFDPVD